MKRLFSSIIIALAILSCNMLILTLPQAIAQGKKKEVILSTVGIDRDYKILGLVYYRSSELSLSRVHKELREQAQGMGADCVIGITYCSHAGYLYGIGTAVKLIENNSKNE